MKNLNSLVNLVNKLSKEEIKTVYKFLKYYTDKNINSKSLELLELILNRKETNSIKIQNLLYGKTNLFAFNKLINRLKEKVLEVVLFDSNISKNYYPQRTKVLFDLKKKLIQCDILNLKGLRDDGDVLCKKIVTRANKYELYDIAVSALILRQRFIKIRKKQIDINKIQIELQLAEEKHKSISKSQNIYNSILNKINNSSDSYTYLGELNSSIDKIEEEVKHFNTDIVNYYLNYLKTELYQIEENYLMANQCLLKINNLLSKKSIYSENRMGTTLLNISNNNIFLNKYNEAILSATNAKKYFPNNVFNQALVNEYLFYSNYYKGNIDEAALIVKKLVNLPMANNIVFSINKWNYFDAIIDFIKKDFNSCIIKLNNVSEINKDREDWNINKRLILIMCRIELNQFESVDLHVNNLEKFIKRSLKKGDIRMRYIYILRIFIKLINTSFNFSEVIKTRARYFELINSNTLSLKWRVKSPELVKIDDWFKSKRF